MAKVALILVEIAAANSVASTIFCYRGRGTTGRDPPGCQQRGWNDVRGSIRLYHYGHFGPPYL